MIGPGHSGSYRKLMNEFVVKADSPGRRMHVADLIKKRSMKALPRFF